jgi:hypothetical protein
MAKNAFKMRRISDFLGKMISELKEYNQLNWNRVQINGIIKNGTQMSAVTKLSLRNIISGATFNYDTGIRILNKIPRN